MVMTASQAYYVNHVAVYTHLCTVYTCINSIYIYQYDTPTTNITL